ncbi:hypothetical protein [Orgyia pseudotsugata single capsid nuclopolyhedrovirus]|nr:hypothetical protein [Orgyia pseudotsugata single capsid nuclopolyhedrovirus]
MENYSKISSSSSSNGENNACSPNQEEINATSTLYGLAVAEYFNTNVKMSSFGTMKEYLAILCFKMYKLYKSKDDLDNCLDETSMTRIVGALCESYIRQDNTWISMYGCHAVKYGMLHDFCQRRKFTRNAANVFDKWMDGEREKKYYRLNLFSSPEQSVKGNGMCDSIGLGYLYYNLLQCNRSVPDKGRLISQDLITCCLRYFFNVKGTINVNDFFNYLSNSIVNYTKQIEINKSAIEIMENLYYIKRSLYKNEHNERYFFDNSNYVCVALYSVLKVCQKHYMLSFEPASLAVEFENDKFIPKEFSIKTIINFYDRRDSSDESSESECESYDLNNKNNRIYRTPEMSRQALMFKEKNIVDSVVYYDNTIKNKKFVYKANVTFKINVVSDNAYYKKLTKRPENKFFLDTILYASTFDTIATTALAGAFAGALVQNDFACKKMFKKINDCDNMVSTFEYFKC